MRRGADTVVAYVAVGSSLEPARHIRAALDMLQQRLRVTAVSTVYQTPAIERPDDPDFFNCVFQVETDADPRSVKFDVLRPIEDALGRDRNADSYSPRTIDLDLVLYGDVVLDQPDLTIPHPDLARWFVCVPIKELAPGLTVPGTDRAPARLDNGAADSYPGLALPDFTAELRRRLTP